MGPNCAAVQPAAPHLMKDSEAYQNLICMLKNEDIPPGTLPKNAQGYHESFFQFNSSQWCTAYNKAKTELGLNLHTDGTDTMNGMYEYINACI